MAAPDADRRKSADGRRTVGGRHPPYLCPNDGGGPAILGLGGPQHTPQEDADSPTARTGKRDYQMPRETVGADDVVDLRPPAIGVATGTTAVVDRPGTNVRPGGCFDGGGICKRFFGIASGTWRQLSDVANLTNGRPELTTTAGGPRNHTVIT